MKLDEIQAYLQKAWQPSRAWHLIPLAKGFFDIHFNNENDMRKTWGSGTCGLPQGVLGCINGKQSNRYPQQNN